MQGSWIGVESVSISAQMRIGIKSRLLEEIASDLFIGNVGCGESRKGGTCVTCGFFLFFKPKNDMFCVRRV